jgi:hypothetical protein
LRNAVIHCLDDGQDLREGDWAQDDVTATLVEVYVSVEEGGSVQGHTTSSSGIGWSPKSALYLPACDTVGLRWTGKEKAAHTKEKIKKGTLLLRCFRRS